jgi:hypothetical protein
METNRDLYLEINDLVTKQSKSKRSLEHYLMSLWELGCNLENLEAISLQQFLNVIAESFSAPVPTFDSTWISRHKLYTEEKGFEGWETTILSQIVDLREMAECGTFKNEHRYFGIDSPRGARWYNFDPGSYLECASAGSLGGWQDGDDTGRQYVPGEVAALDEEGNVVSKNPEEIQNPISPLPLLSWDAFADFLYCGQIYE